MTNGNIFSIEIYTCFEEEGDGVDDAATYVSILNASPSMRFKEGEAKCHLVVPLFCIPFHLRDLLV